MQTTENLSEENKEFYDKTLIKRLLPTLLFSNYGQKKSLSKNNGKTISFRKFNSLNPVQTPLTEGVTPSGNNLSMSEIKATVQQYGDYVEISDVLDMVGIDPVLTETAELLGEQAGMTIDNIVRDVICSGTNVRYVGTASNPATTTDTVSGVMTSKEIQKAVRTLKNDNAKPFDGKYYIGIIDPDISYDLQQDPLFLDVSKYNGGTQIIDGEIGKLGKVRFIETTNTKTITRSDGKTVHCAMIIGKDAYGIVDIDGSAKPEMIVKPHGSSGTADPLNQRATSGWKALFTAKRLNELAMIRIECLTSTEAEFSNNNLYDTTENLLDGLSVDTVQYVNDNYTVTKSGNATIQDGIISVTGEIATVPSGLTPSESNTHAFALKITNQTADYDNLKYTLNDGDEILAEEDGIIVLVETNSNKESQTLKLIKGETIETITINLDGITLA